MTAEEYIRSKLDGLFHTFNVDGAFIVKVVAADFMPSYRGQPVACSEAGKVKAGAQLHWLPEEDDRIIDLRERGITWESIRKMMQRGERAVKERYLVICAERGIEPLIASSAPAAKLTPSVKAQIVALRAQGVSFARIAEALNRPTYQVIDYHSRYLAQKRGKVEVA